jgi:hypothetical protein
MPQRVDVMPSAECDWIIRYIQCMGKIWFVSGYDLSRAEKMGLTNWALAPNFCRAKREFLPNRLTLQGLKPNARDARRHD